MRLPKGKILCVGCCNTIVLTSCMNAKFYGFTVNKEFDRIVNKVHKGDMIAQSKYRDTT